MADKKLTPIEEKIVPDSMKSLVDQLEETIRMTVDAEKCEIKPGFSFAETMKDLTLIKQAVEAMAAEEQDLLETIHSVQERYGSITGAEMLANKEDLAVLEKLKKLETICEQARTRIHDEMMKNPKNQETVKELLEETEASSKRKMTRRKRKFRSMGGEAGGWIKT